MWKRVWANAAEKFVSRPLIAEAFGVFVAAIAFSGKFSMTLTVVLLFISWSMVYLGVRDYSRMIKFSIRLTSLIVVVALAFWSNPQPIPQNSGVLIGGRSAERTGDSVSPSTMIEIGDSEVFLENERVLAPLIDGSQLHVSLLNGRINVSLKVTDRYGAVVAEIIDNEWSIAPPPRTWDRNYSDHALEVIDQYGNVALKIQIADNRIQIQAMWWIILNGERCLMIMMKYIKDRGAILSFIKEDARPEELPKVTAIFKYPSASHFGEMK